MTDLLTEVLATVQLFLTHAGTLEDFYTAALHRLTEITNKKLHKLQTISYILHAQYFAEINFSKG